MVNYMIKLFNSYAKIDTLNTTLLLAAGQNKVFKVYYGEKLLDDESYLPIFDHNLFELFSSTDDTYYSNTFASCNGDGNNIESMVRIVNEDTTFVSRFEFVDFSIVDINKPFNEFPHSLNKKETLQITYKDIINNVILKQYISIFEDSDVISASTKIINESSQTIYVQRLMSLQLDFEASEASYYSLDGAWCRERNIGKHNVKNSIGVIESRSGHSSNLHNPFVILEVPNQGLIASNLIYSGNHKEIIESIPVGKVRFLTGLNDYMMSYKLEVNEKMESVEAIFTYANNLDDITLKMHDFAKKHVLRQDFQNVERPILLNNWEATYFDFSYDKLIKLAQLAKKTGIELFVLDDGWFGKRNTDNCSLGDWFDNVEKTGGLPRLANEIRNMGLQFGIWVEPEMISFDSDLYRNHPEYMMRFMHADPMEKRSQEMLDLVNPEVQNYLIKVLSDLFESVKPNYVKWDCNRNMIDICSTTLKNHGEYFYRYMMGLYNVLYNLTTRFPNIIFESCSAGGNRFDLGMMYYMPQTWASDNSESNSRLYIQEGTLYAYPQNTVGSHVSICPNHQTLFSTSLESRFNVAAIGAFGYELDLEQLTEEELETIKSQIKFYKENRVLLQQGTYYRLDSLTTNENGGWIIVDDKKENAIATIISKHLKYNNIRPKFTFKGLIPNARYQVSMRKQHNVDKYISFEAYGDVLMKSGIDFGELFFSEKDRPSYGNTFASRMILIKKVG